MKDQRREFGSGNLVVALYAIFALSATVRASYQIFRKFEEAPLAYSLSLIAGLVISWRAFLWFVVTSN